MCRLFAMHTGSEPGLATFWLLAASNSLLAQSHYEPDGTGIGTFDSAGTAIVKKEPLTAWKNLAFAEEATTLRSTTFLAHVRYASTGGISRVNTHPFEQDNRIFAHNGVVRGLDELESRLRELGTGALVHGDTDSERMFALITADIRRANGDVAAGIKAAVRWIAEHLPLYSLNFILSEATELWALRFPDANPLHILDRRPDAHTAGGTLDAISQRIRAYSPDLSNRHVVIISTEKMTDDPRWKPLPSGQLVHIDVHRRVHFEQILDSAPRFQLRTEDLDQQAVKSQQPGTHG